MRVEISSQEDATGDCLEIPWTSAEPDRHYIDLRENPKAIDQLDPARRHLPLRTFLAAVNSSDSVFATARCAAGPSAEESSAGGACEFASRVDVLYARQEFNFDRRHWQQAAERVGQLLARDAGEESLNVELRVAPCRFRTVNRSGYSLGILLRARGATPQQAELRWGLALARIQQALLFTSRALRQEKGLVD